MNDIKILINNSQRKDYIDKLNNLDNVENDNELLKLIGISWIGILRTNFNKSLDYNGSKWKSVNYTKYKDNGGVSRKKTIRNSNPLLDTGRLVSSFDYKVKNGILTLGTELDYALAHQNGLNGITKRQILPSKSLFGNSLFKDKAVSVLNLYINKRVK